MADARLAQKFNHLRGLVLGDSPDAALSSSGLPDLRQFARLDTRVRYWNRKGGMVDLVLASSAGALARALPAADARHRFLRFLAGRYAAMNVTWELASSFENDNLSRAVLDDTGNTLKQLDSYHHPLTTGAEITSGPLLDGGWMDFLSYGTADPSIGAIEHQLYQQPAVARLGRENSGAGKSSPSDADAAEFRHRLWNAAMNGQYPVYQNSGAGPAYATSPGARSMTVWFDFMLATRHWDLEPYFELDGGRALALPDVEYIVYVDKPGPVELTVARHSYDVVWMDPADGSTQRHRYSGEHFVGEPPDRFHDWVLHLVREGALQSMNRSYKFESRDVPVQEIQINPEKVPVRNRRARGRPHPRQARLLLRQAEARHSRHPQHALALDVRSDRSSPGLSRPRHHPAGHLLSARRPGPRIPGQPSTPRLRHQRLRNGLYVTQGIRTESMRRSSQRSAVRYTGAVRDRNLVPVFARKSLILGLRTGTFVPVLGFHAGGVLAVECPKPIPEGRLPTALPCP